MKYALITTDGFVIDIVETDPYIPFSPTNNHLELTEEQALQLEQNTRGSWIIDGVIYSDLEYFEKKRFEENPDQVKFGLRRKFASMRYLEEISGIEFNGYLIKTDRVTQSILGNAKQAADEDPAFTIDWKVDDGVFLTLDSNDILALADLMLVHVQNLFSKEKTLNDLIAAASTYEDIRHIKW